MASGARMLNNGSNRHEKQHVKPSPSARTDGSGDVDSEPLLPVKRMNDSDADGWRSDEDGTRPSEKEERTPESPFEELSQHPH
ncbi:hypothetical protein L2E82_01052 [Cichorium intybus]|uniref:Uncharacterized protein n=1 Tax=Cichorium intybus TaxID=13427 RepID=A0ACB9H001_CICIN|nr:hypothetical protein L2E82_01052 [Cichorium intybus]